MMVEDEDFFEMFQSIMQEVRERHPEETENPDNNKLKVKTALHERKQKQIQRRSSFDRSRCGIPKQ